MAEHEMAACDMERLRAHSDSSFSRMTFKGKKLLRIKTGCAGTLEVSIVKLNGDVFCRNVGLMKGVTSVPLESETLAELELGSSTDITSFELLDIPEVSIKGEKPFASPIVCGLASIPSRLPTLKVSVESLLTQVDHLFVYLNGFEEVPGFLSSEKITVFRSQDYGDYRDNSKYFGLRCLRAHAYFFSADDDIRYPPDYVSKLVDAIERYRRQAIVGVHGAIYGAGSRLFLDRAVLHFADAQEVDLPVSALGTGTVAFHTSTLRFDSLDFETSGMADLVLAKIASEHGVPAISIARDSNWLEGLEAPASSANLFKESIVLESSHDQFIRTGAVPGATDIFEAIQGSPSVYEQLTADGISFLRYLVALESNSNLDHLAVPYSGVLRELAAKFRWPSLELAIARGVVLDLWKAGRCLALATAPVREASLGLPQDAVPELVRLVDADCDLWVRLMGEDHYSNSPKDAKAFALSTAQSHGDQKLALDLSIIDLVTEGGPRALLKVYTELLRSDSPELAPPIYQALSQLPSDVSSEARLTRSAAWLEGGEVDRVLADASALIKTGPTGREQVSIAGLVKEKNWSEDLVLSLFSNAHNARRVKRIRGLAKHLLSVPLPSCSPDIWADHMPGMNDEVRRLAATVLLANESWSESISLDSLGLTNEPEATLWRTAIKNATMNEVSLRDAQHAINAVFIASGLLPVEVAGNTNSAGLFQSLVAEPLPPFRDASAPLVSVVMAVYRGEDTIDSSLRSILAQTYPNIEVIIIDDCSPDPLRLPEWARHRPDVKLKRLDENCGPYECRNIALSIACGEFIATHDADDWMHPQKLERQVKTLMTSEAVASYNRHIRLKASGTPALENNGQFIGDGPITSMFRRSIFDTVGGFMGVRSRGDMEFKSRIIGRYRKSRIHHSDAVTLLALDSANSNSKVFTRSLADHRNIGKFKRWYSLEQPVAFFRTSQATPTGMGRLFDPNANS